MTLDAAERRYRYTLDVVFRMRSEADGRLLAALQREAARIEIARAAVAPPFDWIAAWNEVRRRRA